MFKCYKSPTLTFFFPPVTGPEAAPFRPLFPREFPASCLVLVPD